MQKQKDAGYHEDAITYNREVAQCAEKLAKRLKNPRVKAWARGLAKQANYHHKEHQTALKKLLEGQPVEDSGSDEFVHITDHEGNVLATVPSSRVQVVHRSAESGQFVTEAEADENPSTTVEEKVTIVADEVKSVHNAPDGMFVKPDFEETAGKAEEQENNE
jgi:hypothetical protein